MKGLLCCSNGGSINHPGDLGATVLYSSALRKLKRYAEADKLLDSIPSNWSSNTNILMEMALAKIGMNKHDEADTLLAPLLTKGDQQRDRYIHLSKELLEMGMFQKSDTYFAKAMSVRSNMYDYYRRAQAYARVGEKDRALDNLQKAIDQGFTSRQDIENEKSFMMLRSEARWERLVGRLK